MLNWAFGSTLHYWASWHQSQSQTTFLPFFLFLLFLVVFLPISVFLYCAHCLLLFLLTLLSFSCLLASLLFSLPPGPNEHTVLGSSCAIALPPVMGYKYPVRQRHRLKADNEQQEAILKKGQGEITVATVSAGACNVPTQIWGGGYEKGRSLHSKQSYIRMYNNCSMPCT